MNEELKQLINEELNNFFSSGIPISGEEKYSKQEPGGTMAAVNVDEILNELSSIDEENIRIYNQTLCPVLWDDHQHLDPKTRVNLLRMAYDFYEKTGFKAPIVDVYLMGSIANFNWNEESDADVHVMIDYSQLQMPEETVKEVIRTVGSQWNSEHNAVVKGHKVELNLQNIKEQKPHVTGIYSLTKDEWVRKPVHQNVQVDKMLIQTKYKGMKKYIEAVINSGDREAMKQAKKYIDAFRQYGLDTRGELSTENIVFKILRSKGLLKSLKDCIISTYDKEMSVKENGNPFDNVELSPQSFSSGNYFHTTALEQKNPLGLKAAAKTPNGDIIKGSTGQHHCQLKYPDGSILGFVTKDGKFLTRSEASRLTQKALGHNVDEGYGAGIPSQDRLNIKGNRWQIRSKDAPKTPKMTEHVYTPLKDNPSPEISKSNRIDLFPKSFKDSYPLLNNLLSSITDILDKKSKRGVKEFSSDYIDNLIDDVFSYNLKSPLSNNIQTLLKRWIKDKIKRDYKIV